MNCAMNPPGEPGGSENTPNLYRPFATPADGSTSDLEEPHS